MWLRLRRRRGGWWRSTLRKTWESAWRLVLHPTPLSFDDGGAWEWRARRCHHRVVVTIRYPRHRGALVAPWECTQTGRGEGTSSHTFLFTCFSAPLPLSTSVVHPQDTEGVGGDQSGPAVELFRGPQGGQPVRRGLQTSPPPPRRCWRPPFSQIWTTPPMKCLWFCRARPPCLTAFPRYKYRLATGGYSITQLHGGGIVLLSTPKRHNERGGGGNCTPLHYPLGSPLPCAHCYCKLSPRRCASSRRGVCGRLHTLRNVPVHLMLRSFVGRFITTLTPFFPTRLSPPYHYHCTSLPMHT